MQVGVAERRRVAIVANARRAEGAGDAQGHDGAHHEPRKRGPSDMEHAGTVLAAPASFGERGPTLLVVLRIQSALPDAYTAASQDELAERIAAAKDQLGSRLFILGHHYQREEVMRWADARGDSFRLSVLAQQHPEADFIVFCGVHFMAESADILTGDHQQVVLPDLNAGCSMADMADIESVQRRGRRSSGLSTSNRWCPITYMNSSAALKAFVGEHGGAVCTSTTPGPCSSGRFGPTAAGTKVLFFPDQHLGRNTGLAMGYRLDDMAVWNPRYELGGMTEADLKEKTFLLWKGHCSVHQLFRPEHVEAFRAEHPGGIVIMHPECAYDVVPDGRRRRLHRLHHQGHRRRAAGQRHRRRHRDPPGQRLAAEHPDKTIMSLDPLICPCSTMFRIDAAAPAWVLENLVAGKVVNRITVDAETARWAKVALERMLAIT